MNFFLQLLDRLGRRRIIMDRQDQAPYLERYYLLFNTRQHRVVNVFLHKFLKSDPDEPHDHPWPYFTLILRGGYYEWIPQFNADGIKTCEIRKWRGPGHFRFNRATSLHRIEVHNDITAWTLFVPGPHVRQWGFIVDNAWVHNDQYLEAMRTK
jgi:hypothetical protein